MADPHATRARAAIDRGAKVASIYRTEREDKVQLDLMQDDPNGARLGGGALLLNIHAGHGLNPGDQVRVRIEHV